MAARNVLNSLRTFMCNCVRESAGLVSMALGCATFCGPSLSLESWRRLSKVERLDAEPAKLEIEIEVQASGGPKVSRQQPPFHSN